MLHIDDGGDGGGGGARGVSGNVACGGDVSGNDGGGASGNVDCGAHRGVVGADRGIADDATGADAGCTAPVGRAAGVGPTGTDEGAGEDSVRG